MVFFLNFQSLIWCPLQCYYRTSTQLTSHRANPRPVSQQINNCWWNLIHSVQLWVKTVQTSTYTIFNMDFLVFFLASMGKFCLFTEPLLTRHVLTKFLELSYVLREIHLPYQSFINLFITKDQRERLFVNVSLCRLSYFFLFYFFFLCVCVKSGFGVEDLNIITSS